LHQKGAQGDDPANATRCVIHSWGVQKEMVVEALKREKKLNPGMTGSEAERLRCDLKKMIVGQNEAVDQIVSVYQTFLAGMNSPGRPIGNLLFLGPTGTGKTRLVEATAESLLGNPRAVIKIDCAEFQHSHEIAKLIGSPPGYLGHRETHPLLSEEALSEYHTSTMKISFLLFDEIEKASDALWNLLLGVLDKGILTLGDNRRVDFSRCLIFMTSNLGAAEMAQITRPNLGFNTGESEHAGAAEVPNGMQAKVARAAVEAARRKFTPEFMNRIDKIVVFESLGKAQLDRILTLELDQLRARILVAARGVSFGFRLTHEASEFVLREGIDIKYGARHLKRAIDRLLVHQLSNLIASGQIHAGDLLRVDFDAELGALSFEREEEGMTEAALFRTLELSPAARSLAAAA
jgi:ATP-dependent Clp protease ATP-binding subunit ClpB